MIPSFSMYDISPYDHAKFI